MKTYPARHAGLLALFILCVAPNPFVATEAGGAQLTSQERDLLTSQIKPFYDKADIGSRWWSVAFHGCIFLSAVASAAAALILKLDRLKQKSWREDLATCFAALAALLPLISTSGDFSQKWITNRATRAALSDLLLEIQLAADNPSPAASDFAQRFKDIIAQHERGIAPGGESPMTHTNTGQTSNNEKESP